MLTYCILFVLENKFTQILYLTYFTWVFSVYLYLHQISEGNIVLFTHYIAVIILINIYTIKTYYQFIQYDALLYIELSYIKQLKFAQLQPATTLRYILLPLLK